MDAGVLGGIIGGTVGLMGGALGTFFAIRSTKSANEKAFVIRFGIGVWLAALLFLALLFAVPAPYKWLLWVPYGIALPIAINWMNRAQARIRAQAMANESTGGTTGATITSTFSRMRWFVPRFAGEVELAKVPDDYAARIEERVAEGFLVRGNRNRANYLVQPDTGDGVRIVAGDFWTAINLGLNNVLVRRKDAQHLAYEVSFWRWTRYGVWLGGSILAFVFAGFAVAKLLSWTLPPMGFEALAGLSCGLFFGVCWPWVLTEIHKKSAAHCLERILRETLEAE